MSSLYLSSSNELIIFWAYIKKTTKSFEKSSEKKGWQNLLRKNPQGNRN